MINVRAAPHPPPRRDKRCIRSGGHTDRYARARRARAATRSAPTRGNGHAQQATSAVLVRHSEPPAAWDGLRSAGLAHGQLCPRGDLALASLCCRIRCPMPNLCPMPCGAPEARCPTYVQCPFAWPILPPGVLFLLSGGTVAWTVALEPGGGESRVLLLGFAALVSTSGVLCFLLERDWSHGLSRGAKVPPCLL